MTAAFLSIGSIFLGKLMAFFILLGGDAELTIVLFMFSMRPIDGFFILLAFFSAYKVGAGIADD
ncbi:MAG: hypothetical protein R3C11_13455 [Planctomycetaceae bacterium]